jgi:hypothetical protein
VASEEFVGVLVSFEESVGAVLVSEELVFVLEEFVLAGTSEELESAGVSV